MSLRLPILRPAVWTDVDRGRSYPVQEAPRAGPSTSGNVHYLSEVEESPRKRKKVIGEPALYYPPALSPSERLWRDRSEYLLHKGYQLRPRYQMEWTPTRLGNGRHFHSGEDHIMQILPQVLDAIRKQDGLVVCIKMISETAKLKQLKITDYLRRVIDDSRNHVVPLYHTFGDCFAPHINFMVMPVLRRFDDPEFVMVGEIMDFVTQVLEGLAFLHHHRVAHHNIVPEHIMMDAKTLIPTGWHFVAHFCEPDGMAKIAPLDRRTHPVRYYYIGFGNCHHIARNSPPLIMDIGGSDDDAPELFQSTPYDPFKYDVYTLGNVLLKQILQKYQNLDFLSDLVNFMRIPEFEQRPGIEAVLDSWRKIRRGLDEDALDDLQLVLKEVPTTPQRQMDDNGSNAEGSPRSSASARSAKRDISSILNA